MNTYHRDSNRYIFKDPLNVKRSSRWRLVPMEGQRFTPGRPNWLIIDLIVICLVWLTVEILVIIQLKLAVV